MATLKDIAKMVGVSVPTVSKVLNNKSQKCASTETQNRIWQLVHELGYTPNKHAKNLASLGNEQKIKNIIAICLCEEKDTFLINYYENIRKKLEEAILSYIHIPYICDVDSIFSKESPIPSHQTIAVVLLGEPTSRIVTNLSRIVQNILVISLYDGTVGCDKVNCNLKKAVRETISLAYYRKYNTIFYVGQKKSKILIACKEYCDKANVKIISSDNTMSGGYIAGLHIKRLEPESMQIICEGAEIAKGLQRALFAEGFDKSQVQFLVLGDIEDIGDPFPYDRIVIDMGINEMVNLGLELLMDRIKRQHHIAVVYELDNMKYNIEAGEKTWKALP